MYYVHIIFYFITSQLPWYSNDSGTVLARMHLMRRISGLSQVDVDLELHDTEGEILAHISMKTT